MEAYTVDGKIYCLPSDLSSQLILCNLDIFEEMGVEFKPEGYSMDEFIEISKKLTNENHFASDIYPNSWTLNAFLLSAGVPVLDLDGNINLDTLEMAEFFQWLVDLGLNHKTQIPLDRAGRNAAAYFISKRVAMYDLNPEWVMKIRTDMPDARLDVMRLPHSDSPSRGTDVVGGSFAASSKTKYPDIAWDFLKFYTDGDKLGRIVGATHRGIPGRRSVADTMLTSDLSVPHSYLFFDVLEGGTNIDYPRFTECEIEVNPILDAMYIGRLPVKQALADAMTNVREVQSR
jgi:ABC-type glycerol-3-phosphate transport system substrate-binding protein